jgi:chromosome segregation ATPase
MSDKTFGVKVSEDLHDKVKSMIDSSGLSSKEWFEKAVALTEVQELKTGSPDYKQDLSELEIHTMRIYELVANMIQRSNYIKDDAVRDLNEKLNSRDFTISNLQGSVKEFQERLSELEEETKQNVADKEDLVNQLEGQRSINTNNQALIQEYKEKIDTLSSLVNQYKGYATENAELKESFAADKESITTEFQQKESQLVSSVEELKATVSGQQDQIEKLNQTNESLRINQENELTRLTESKDLEKERAVLEVERQYQEKLQEIHNQYNEKLARLYEKFETQANSNTNSSNSKKPVNRK